MSPERVISQTAYSKRARGRSMRRQLALAAASATLLVPLTSAAAAHATGPVSRQQDFAAAAAASGVPDQVLLAVAYNESLWEQHAGEPSTSGSYGVMALSA